MKLMEIVKEFFEDLNAASDELAGEAIEVFNIEDIEDLKKDGELVPSTDSTLNSVTSEKSRKSKAPIGPINKMRLFLYSTIKKSLTEIKENTDKKFEENMKNINDSISDGVPTEELNKELIETTKLKANSNKLQDAIEKVEERVEQVEAEIQEKIDKKEQEKLEKETKKDISNMFKTMKSIEQSEIQPISVEQPEEKQLEESEKVVSENEQNLAYMVSAIKNNEEKEKAMQPISVEMPEEKEVEVQEKTDADLFEDFIATRKEMREKAVDAALDEIKVALTRVMNNDAAMENSEAAKMCTRLSTELVNEKQSHMQDLENKEAEWQQKYASLEQSTKQTVEQKDKQISELEMTVNNYKTVTEQKDKQIAEQEDTIKSKDEEIAKLTEKLAMLEKNNSALETEVIRLQPYEESVKKLQNVLVPQEQTIVTEETHKTL